MAKTKKPKAKKPASLTKLEKRIMENIWLLMSQYDWSADYWYMCDERCAKVVRRALREARRG